MQSVPTKALPLQLIQLDDNEDVVRGEDGFCVRASEGKYIIHLQLIYSAKIYGEKLEDFFLWSTSFTEWYT